ncbi:MAG: peptidoglycan D,D-transpeptidase FtsI family protein, partial [Minisyncoccia bacterium]
MFNFFRKRKYRDYDFNPDEVFMDTINVSGLDTQQFEGVIEKPISRKSLLLFGLFFVLVFIIFTVKLIDLQIINGADFFAKSENNTLRSSPLFAERGVIYDRHDVELAWNQDSETEKDFLNRAYIREPGFGHILGYVNYPQQDNSGNYWRDEIAGQAALEKKYNKELQGNNGSLLFEVDAIGKVISENSITAPVDGVNIHTTLDARLQTYMYQAIESQATEFGFDAGAGAIMNIHSGELLTLTSYPEYDPYTLAEGQDSEKISGFFNDPQKPFLNRAISGLYSPGSTVKPFLALAALHEGLITKNTKIKSVGSIEIPNIYNPNNASVFKDWRSGGHGITDVRFAIADSVNTFFYAIGGGYKDQEGLGITKIEKYLRSFDIAAKTNIDFGVEQDGTIPSPAWKKENYTDGAWRLGDTYITSIGQFGFLVSPIQMLRATAALANDGILHEPLLVKKNAVSKSISEDILFEHYQTIRAGMRDTVTQGSAQNINVDYIDIAAKTGTAQVGVNNEFYNSWIIGFFPYHDPQYAFTIVMEHA